MIAGGNHGFTFIEVISALALMAVLAAILGMGLVAAMQSYDFSRANVQVAQKGEMAMARIMRELTELTAVHEATDSSITYERVETDGERPQSMRFRIYFNDPDTIFLARGIGEDQSHPLVNTVAGFSLQYFEGGNEWPGGGEAPLLSAIRITLDLQRPDSPQNVQRFSTLVHLRNNNNDGGEVP